MAVHGRYSLGALAVTVGMRAPRGGRTLARLLPGGQPLLAATRMLSTGLGYRRPARLAERRALAFSAGVR